MNHHFLLALVALVVLGAASAQNECTSLNPGDTSPDYPFQVFFGNKDSPTNESYHLGLSCCWWGSSNSDFYSGVEEYMDSFMENIGNFWINQIPLLGGKNFSRDLDGNVVFNPTASFVCGDDGYSALWGPSYPSYRERDTGERAQFENIETYVHYSAPPQSSYIRFILFMENKGSAPERLHLWSDWFTNDYGLDISPYNDGRYFVPFPFQDGDLGQTGSNPAAEYTVVLSSAHARGPKARNNRAIVYADMDNYIVSFVHHDQIQAGEKMAFMVVVAFGRNKTQMLDTAAMIDTEGAELFHGLNADQLALIVNWGACEAVLAEQVAVTVTAPTQCGQTTSDFTVQTSTDRTDFTSDFTHRVVLGNTEVVAAQASSTLAVPNNAGSVTHQLWYKACMIKQTAFTACAPVASAAPVATPATSSANVLAVSMASVSLLVLALL